MARKEHLMPYAIIYHNEHRYDNPAMEAVSHFSTSHGLFGEFFV